MSFATANRTTLYRVKEVTFGTTPASPVLKETRNTGEELLDGITTEKSKEIRSDRMISDLFVVDAEPGGSINIEMSTTTYDDLLESVAMSAWSAQLAIVGVAGDISTVTGTNKLTSTTADKFINVVVGQWIQLSGFTSLVNGFYQVTTKTSNVDLTLSPAIAASETPAGTAANVDGSYVRNGITEQSYSLVKLFADATTATRQVFTGMRVKSFGLEVQTASLMTGSFGFMGKTASWTEAAFAGETTSAASTTDVLNCVSNLTNLTQDGAALGSTGSVMQMSLEIDNQHRSQKGVGVLGNVGIAAGSIMASVSASQYFESKAQADKFRNSTAFSYSFRLADTAGNAYVFTLPRCKYTEFKVNSSAIDTDVMAETTFEATRDPVTNCMFQIDRFVA